MRRVPGGAASRGTSTGHGIQALEHEGRVLYPATGIARHSLVDIGLVLFVLLALIVSLDAVPVPVLFTLGGLFTLLGVVFVLHGRERVRITADEVLVRSRFRRRAVSRSAIAQLVHVHDIKIRSLASMTVLLDFMGNALWRSTGRWSGATIAALAGVAQHSVNLPSLTPEQAREHWPGMLPWRYARAGRVVLIYVVAWLGAVFLVFLTGALIVTSMV